VLEAMKCALKASVGTFKASSMGSPEAMASKWLSHDDPDRHAVARRTPQLVAHCYVPAGSLARFKLTCRTLRSRMTLVYFDEMG
jgi:hypothetical protein